MPENYHVPPSNRPGDAAQNQKQIAIEEPRLHAPTTNPIDPNPAQPSQIPIPGIQSNLTISLA